MVWWCGGGVWCGGVWCVLRVSCCVVLHANTDVTTLLLPEKPDCEDTWVPKAGHPWCYVGGACAGGSVYGEGQWKACR